MKHQGDGLSHRQIPVDVAVTLDLFSLAGLFVGGECTPLDDVAVYFEFDTVHCGGSLSHLVGLLYLK